MNLSDLKNIFDNDRINSEALKRLVPLYVNELNKDLLELDFKSKAEEEGDFNRLTFHKIKGDALSYGVIELVELIKNRNSLVAFELEFKKMVQRINKDAKAY